MKVQTEVHRNKCESSDRSESISRNIRNTQNIRIKHSVDTIANPIFPNKMLDVFGMVSWWACMLEYFGDAMGGGWDVFVAVFSGIV